MTSGSLGPLASGDGVTPVPRDARDRASGSGNESTAARSRGTGADRARHQRVPSSAPRAVASAVGAVRSVCWRARTSAHPDVNHATSSAARATASSAARRAPSSSRAHLASLHAYRALTEMISDAAPDRARASAEDRDRHVDRTGLQIARWPNTCSSSSARVTTRSCGDTASGRCRLARVKVVRARRDHDHPREIDQRAIDVDLVERLARRGAPPSTRTRASSSRRRTAWSRSRPRPPSGRGPCRPRSRARSASGSASRAWRHAGAADLHPVEPRQHQIEHDEVERIPQPASTPATPSPTAATS